jgi:hypothetical protein
VNMTSRSRALIQPLGSVAIAGLIVWLFFSLFIFPPIRDFDDFWHLWAGRQILETGTVTRIDPVCFSSGSLDWVNLNWLSQVLNYRLFELYGLAGPVALASLAAAIVLFCHVILLRHEKIGAIGAGLTLALLFFRDYMSFSTRPQVYSFALLALLNLLLKLSGNYRRLPPTRAALGLVLMLIWNNLHGGAIFGYALLGCDLVGSAIEQRRIGGGWWNQRCTALTLIGAGALAGFILHPHGIAALMHLLFYGNSMQKEFYERITELQPIDFGLPAGKVYLGYVVCFMAALYWTRRFSPVRELLAFLVFAAFTQSMRRFFTPLAVVSAPFAAAMLNQIIAEGQGRVAQWTQRFEKAAGDLYSTAFAALAAAILGWFVIFLPHETTGENPGNTESKLIDPNLFPGKIARYLQTEGTSGLIFNDYNLGGYLGWALYPTRRIFIDGRGDLHSLGPAYSQYLSIITLEPGWRDLLQGLNVRYVVILADRPLAQELRRDPNWHVALQDRFYLLLERSALKAAE